jgi:hypothetical protein
MKFAKQNFLFLIPSRNSYGRYPKDAKFRNSEYKITKQKYRQICSTMEFAEQNLLSSIPSQTFYGM